jgi:hypothetical protein
MGTNRMLILKHPRPTLTAAAALATLVLFAGTPTAGAAPAGPSSPTQTRASIVETTFKSVDAVIAAQWDFPERSPAPLVVLIPAGGRIDRNGWHAGTGQSPEHGIYAALARELVRAGFAVFRFDKPGAGKSSRGRFSTERSNALEAYTRAVDHARIDPDNAFLIGHAGGTDTIAGIYPRYAEVLPPSGVVFLNNSVGETDSLRIEAPLLIVNAGKNPDDRLQYGSFIVETRDKRGEGKLDTDLVILEHAEPGLLAPTESGSETVYTVDPAAVSATVSWLSGRVGNSRSAELR